MNYNIVDMKLGAALFSLVMGLLMQFEFIEDLKAPNLIIISAILFMQYFILKLFIKD